MRSSMWFVSRFVFVVFALGATAGCTVNNNHGCDPENGGGVRWCESNDDCEDLSVTCDRETNRCRTRRSDAGAPDAPNSPYTADAGMASHCSSAADCPNGSVCSDARCLPASEACQFDFQCSEARECVDGRCLQRCATTATNPSCAAGQRCSADGHCRYADPADSRCPSPCAADQRCVGSVCLAACSTDTTCTTGQRCESGTCRADDRRAPPFCAGDAQCASGSVCRAGVCRAACPSSTDDECQRRDVNFNRCSVDLVCMSTGEIAPACALSIDCATGQSCINARCL